MSVTIELYNLSKRTNSTKQPTAPAAVTLTAEIKAPCSILTPILELATDPSAYNYCYLDKFQRYYFIGDITFNRGLWIVTLSVDTLATYKSAIGSYSGYVLRSASERDEYILDNRYINTSNTTHSSNTVTESLINWDDGVYIVNVLASAGSGTLSYQFTPSGFSAFYNSINTAIDGFNWTDVPTALKNSLLNPLQYVTSAYWFPKAFSGSTVNSIKLGLTNVSTAADTKAIEVYAHRTYDLAIPKHPQATTIGKYVNLAPFTRYTLTWGPLGTVPLDPSLMVSADKIRVSEDVDPATGQAIISCVALNGNAVVGYLFENTCGWGVPVQMSATQSNMGSALVNAGKAIGNFAAWYATGDPERLRKSASNVGNMITDTVPSTSTISSAGSLVAHNTVKAIDAVFYEHVGVDVAHNGRPLCQTRTISTLSGYTVLQSGAIDLNCTAAERDQIRAYLEGGFYYE